MLDEPFLALLNLRHLSISGKGLNVIKWLVNFLRDVEGSRLQDILVSVSDAVNTPHNKIWSELNALVAVRSIFPDLFCVRVFFDDEIGLAEEKRIVASFSSYLTCGLFELTSPTIEGDGDQD